MVKKGEQSSAIVALYRKYRPRSLGDVVSQPQTTEILKRSLKQGKIAHAYLLTGPKGVGKTSIARILAHEINNLPYSDSTHLDIIEIDAASNNSVEDVRDLRDRVQIAPVSASKKVYIIDEVHMLSKSAFNALLKTLEEPPAHVVFILATTDLHKVPATIISRTQHFAFHAIGQKDLAEQLKKIAKLEGISITQEALDAIASRGDGSFRNSISLLDQLSGYADAKDGITLELVQSTLGLAPADSVKALLLAIHSGDVASVVAQMETLEIDGIQPSILADQIIRGIRTELTQRPEGAELIDQLIAVATSPQPQLKLLSIAVSASAKNSSAHNKTEKTIATSAVKKQPSVIEAPVLVVDKSKLEKPQPKQSTQVAAADPQETPKTSSSGPAPDTLEWDDMVSFAKEKFVALYSVLVKCGHEYDKGKLVLYAGRKFNKSKLEEPKYNAQLREALDHVGCAAVELSILPTTKPPEDENLAKIADMMGGGHEVKIDD